MRDKITAETMKEDAAKYITRHVTMHRGVPDKAAAEIIAMLTEEGVKRELIILLMCGFAAAVVEGALLLAESRRGER